MLLLLLLVAFCLVTDVHKFYFKLVLNKTPKQSRTLGSNGFDRDVLWQDTVSSWQSYTADNGPGLHCKGQSYSPDSTIISGKKGGENARIINSWLHSIKFSSSKWEIRTCIRYRLCHSLATVRCTFEVPADCKELKEARALSFSQQRCLKIHAFWNFILPGLVNIYRRFDGSHRPHL